MSQAVATHPFSVAVSRRIDASPAEIYRAWTEPARFRVWFDYLAELIMNAEVNGLYYMGSNWQGRIKPHYGRYLRLERDRLIEMTWMSEYTHGRETVVTITLAPVDGGTELRLTHVGFPDEELRRMHEEGWAHHVGELAKRVPRG